MVADLIDATSIHDPAFREQAYAAIAANGEMLVAYYLANGGGWQEWHMVRTRTELDALLQAGKRRSIFDLYLTPQLPLRGPAGAELEEATIALLSEHGEVMMAVQAEPEPPKAAIALAVATYLDHAGADEEADVRDWFAEYRGARVMAGVHPASRLGYCPGVLSGRVPDEDGSIRSAAF